MAATANGAMIVVYFLFAAVCLIIGFNITFLESTMLFQNCQWLQGHGASFLNCSIIPRNEIPSLALHGVGVMLSLAALTVIYNLRSR